MGTKKHEVTEKNKRAKNQCCKRNRTVVNKERSLVESLLGPYTSSFIVAALFLITIICFTIFFLNFKSNLSNNITTGFISLLSGLAGFFVASLKSSQ